MRVELTIYKKRNKYGIESYHPSKKKALVKLKNAKKDKSFYGSTIIQIRPEFYNKVTKQK